MLLELKLVDKTILIQSSKVTKPQQGLAAEPQRILHFAGKIIKMLHVSINGEVGAISPFRKEFTASLSSSSKSLESLYFVPW
jgi:hypothetical protein